MGDYRFDGRVALITGAGRGIGRAHALFLADLGASIVVNDLGGTKEGTGADPEPAHFVVDEIVRRGGRAVADVSDVSTVDGCETVVDAALVEFGHIDIVVNNAGNSWFGTFPEVSAENLERTFAIHVGGAWHTTRAAWPHMVKRGFGRVVMTTSTGIFGLADNLSYATVKGALIGMTRSLSLAGEPHGITVNCLAPVAATRRGSQQASVAAGVASSEGKDPDLVPAMLGYLAHERCDVTGEILVAGAGRFARLFISSTEGYVHEGSGTPTVDDVADNWADIVDDAGYYVPANLPEWVDRYLTHLPTPTVGAR